MIQIKLDFIYKLVNLNFDSYSFLSFLITHDKVIFKTPNNNKLTIKNILHSSFIYLFKLSILKSPENVLSTAQFMEDISQSRKR